MGLLNRYTRTRVWGRVDETGKREQLWSACGMSAATAKCDG